MADFSLPRSSASPRLKVFNPGIYSGASFAGSGWAVRLIRRRYGRFAGGDFANGLGSRGQTFHATRPFSTFEHGEFDSLGRFFAARKLFPAWLPRGKVGQRMAKQREREREILSAASMPAETLRETFDDGCTRQRPPRITDRGIPREMPNNGRGELSVKEIDSETEEAAALPRCRVAAVPSAPQTSFPPGRTPDAEIHRSLSRVAARKSTGRSVPANIHRTIPSFPARSTTTVSVTGDGRRDEYDAR